MRCAACNHRWMRGQEDADEVPEPVVLTAVTPVIVDPVGAEPVIEKLDDDDETAPPSVVMRTVFAVVVGAALAIGAGAVWMSRVDPGALPVIGGELAALTPGNLPLQVVFTARTTPLPSGDRLLEIKGNVRNTGTVQLTMPDLEARLAGPAGTVRRWRIAAPVPVLAPGGAAAFSSTATGFPETATIVGIRPAG